MQQNELDHNLYRQYQQKRVAHWDQVARRSDSWEGLGKTYHQLLSHYYKLHIPKQKRVLEIGCGLGDLLNLLEPAFGVGLDFSGAMLHRAAKRYPDLFFVQADAHHLPSDHKFDFVILSDLVNDLWDVQQMFEFIHLVSHPGTRMIINTYSRLWQPVLQAARKLGLSKPNLTQNWFTPEDLHNLLHLTDFEVVRSSREIIFPFQVPVISALANRFLARVWPFNHLALTNFIIARPEAIQAPSHASTQPTVSVIVPARNEAGNIEQIFTRIPEMGAKTELVFVEGGSSDNTYAVIEENIQRRSQRPAKLLKQTGKGKGDAVRLGFANASGDILMILDADLTVPPEMLPRFFDALVSGKAEFVNGVRLVYPMENRAMQFANLIGNKLFSLTFSWLLGQSVKDTLCGTKVLWEKDYEEIALNRSYFGDFDPFGDFDLLFGATKLNLKIVDLPVRYRQRTYGSTNISRWRHGWLLLRMTAFAASRLKFV